MVVNDRVLRFGFKQYMILDLLLTHQEVKDDTLYLALYQQKPNTDNCKLMANDISKLRCRLEVYNLGIARIYGEGYKLVELAKTLG